jgi:hypothetical protein
MDKTAILDFLGMTKEIDREDGSKEKTFDQKAFSEKMADVSKVAQEMTKVPESPGLLRTPQVNSSPAPMAAQLPNPYAPVGYNPMTYQGGIGRTPSMEEILKALQSRSY